FNNAFRALFLCYERGELERYKIRPTPTFAPGREDRTLSFVILAAGGYQTPRIMRCGKRGYLPMGISV
ncbi:hypothetical protein, partial [Paradesulfitobacterium aromaticivorans]